MLGGTSVFARQPGRFQLGPLLGGSPASGNLAPPVAGLPAAAATVILNKRSILDKRLILNTDHLPPEANAAWRPSR